MTKRDTTDLTVREKLTLWLFLWMMNIISPWEYDHQQKEYVELLKKVLKGDKS